MPIKGPSRGTSNEQQTACWQGRGAVAWASLVEMLLTFPVWVPEGLALNTISCSGQSIAYIFPPPLLAGPLQGLAAGGGQAGAYPDLWGASSQVSPCHSTSPSSSSKGPRCKDPGDVSLS